MPRAARSLLPLLLCFLLPALAPDAAAQAQGTATPRTPRDRTVTVGNEYPTGLQQLFVFPAGAAEEGPDRLGAYVLPPRATLRIPLGRTAACAFEVRATLEGGEEVRRRVDVCRSPRVTLAETGSRREIEVTNDAEAELRELYLWPSNARPGAAERQEDRLGTGTVAAGDSTRLRLRAERRDCLFDLRAVFEDGTEETRQRLDLCRAPRLGFGDPATPLLEVPVMNRALGAVQELYAAPTAAAAEGRWGPDRLGSAVLEPRATTRLRVRSRDCLFDLRAVYDERRTEVLRNIDLCRVQGVVLGEGAAAAARPPRRLTVANGHRRTVQQLFLSPSESQDWGEDALGADRLAQGAERVLEAEPGASCKADLRIVFDTGAAEERRDIDLCAEDRVVLRPGWTVEALVPVAAEAPEKARSDAPGAEKTPEPAPGAAEPEPEPAESPAAPAGGGATAPR